MCDSEKYSDLSPRMANALELKTMNVVVVIARSGRDGALISHEIGHRLTPAFSGGGAKRFEQIPMHARRLDA